VQVSASEAVLPRIPDASLSDRILDSAYELLHKNGMAAVTLREVAMHAGTTTPTVYARFATKEDLLMALADRLRIEFVDEFTKAPTVMKAAQRYLELAIERPYDYKLMFEVGWPNMFTPQHGILWGRERLAEVHGGEPEDYEQVVNALWMQLHGGASLLLRAQTPEITKYLLESCLSSCAVIVAKAEAFTCSSHRTLTL
jgi:AcrR family transcriptional regulator